MSDFRRSQPAYPAVIPEELVASNGLAAGDARIFPVAGISRTWTVHSRESGVWTHYVSDEHGFNNPPGSHSTNPDSIVLVGDSFVHGAAVWAGEDFAGQMRQLGQPSLNLGIWGNGPLVELATLTEYAIRLRPRAIIWFYYEGNDLLGDFRPEQGAGLLMSYLKEGYSQNLVGHQVLIDQLLKDYCDTQELKARGVAQDQQKPASVPTTSVQRIVGSAPARFVCLGHLRRWLEQWWQCRKHNTRLTSGEVGPVDWELFEQVFAAASRRAVQSGAAFYFVYLPDQIRFHLGEHRNSKYLSATV